MDTAILSSVYMGSLEPTKSVSVTPGSGCISASDTYTFTVFAGKSGKEWCNV